MPCARDFIIMQTTRGERADEGPPYLGPPPKKRPVEGEGEQMIKNFLSKMLFSFFSRLFQVAERTAGGTRRAAPLGIISAFRLLESEWLKGAAAL